ncbi:MAG: DMT family transporter [Bacteroidota bacterium]|nr:DMT family transporter [Bacteroidota bacterium]MDP4229101.1 DMT family transporter [Bacteroidota bacterium]MDP4235025.1 DMT family transporter [Bacteroidota bacterium]
MHHANRRGSLFIVLAALFWSTGGLFIKSVSLDAFGISLWRSSLAAITLYILYRINFFGKRSNPSAQNGLDPIPSRKEWYSLRTVSTAMVYAALLILFVMATKLTTSANAIFLQYTAPIYVLFFDPIISRTKIKLADIIAVFITIAAMGLFFIGEFDTSSVLGNILALASGLCFAAYALLLKHEKTTEAMRWQSVIVGHVIIVIIMLFLFLTGNALAVPQNIGEAGKLLFLGIVQIGVAYAFFTKGIHHVRALDALLISMLEPVLNPVWVYLGIGETPGEYAIAGGAIILAVVIIRTWSEGRKTSIPIPMP